MLKSGAAGLLAVVLMAGGARGAAGATDQTPDLGAEAAAAPDPGMDLSLDSRMEWWREARFGLFIHWGLYAIPAGEWNGQTSHGEWIRTTAQIPRETYAEFLPRFNPVNFDARAWARAAKHAGMKYIVITTKHHDGFALFDSAVSDFDVMATPFGRDIMRELADACRAEGLQICWYHSIMDWSHPDYLPRREWERAARPEGDADMARFEAYLHAQVREILTNYGPIGVMWFDGEWESTWTDAHGRRLYDLCRSIQPDVIVNNRVGKARDGMAGLSRGENPLGDFGTPEQEVPAKGLPGVDWESCMTMNDHWGFNARDQNYKSSTELVRTLIDIASKGGNFLLNVGPTPLGEFPPESLERLDAIGAWMRVNAPAIHGTTASPFGLLPWGRCTARTGPDASTLYLHVFDWPADGLLRLEGLANEIESARVLGDPWRPLPHTRQGPEVALNLAGVAPREHATVIAVRLNGTPRVVVAPAIAGPEPEFWQPIEVSLAGDGEVRYTLDGSEPTSASPVAAGPIRIERDCDLVARVFVQGRPVSPAARQSYRRAALLPASGRQPAQVGELEIEEFPRSVDLLPDFGSLTPARSLRVRASALSEACGAQHTARRVHGFVFARAEGLVHYRMTSDDGARLWIGGRLVIDHDGLHAEESRTGRVALEAGWHEIRIEHFNRTGPGVLRLESSTDGATWRAVADEEMGAG